MKPKIYIKNMEDWTEVYADEKLIYSKKTCFPEVDEILELLGFEVDEQYFHWCYECEEEYEDGESHYCEPETYFSLQNEEDFHDTKNVLS